MAFADAASEASVFPGMVEMVIRVSLACIVADPLAVGVDVGRLRMIDFVHIGVLRGWRRGVRRGLGGRGSAFGNVSAANFRLAAPMFFLGKRWERNRKRDGAQTDE